MSELSATASSGVQKIAEERARQVADEKWTPAHDDAHDNGELAQAATAYARSDWHRKFAWPFVDGYKPTPENRIRELVKAGALLAAEIDRLERRDCICDRILDTPDPTCPIHGADVDVVAGEAHIQGRSSVQVGVPSPGGD